MHLIQTSIARPLLKSTIQVAYDDAQAMISTYVKIYPHKKRLIVYNDPYMKRKPDLETPHRAVGGHSRLERGAVGDANDLSRSLRRSRSAITDVVLTNKFDLWVTFTFAKDRENIDHCKQKMRDWLKSQQKTHGKFSYLLVIEFHKDKQSIHFHGFFRGYKGKLVKASHKATGRSIIDRFGNQVYNIASYRSGFTTAVKMPTNEEEIEKVSNYVRKYMSKELHDQFRDLDNKKRYWVSKDVKRPEKLLNAKVERNPDHEIVVHETDFYKIIDIYPKSRHNKDTQ